MYHLRTVKHVGVRSGILNFGKKIGYALLPPGVILHDDSEPSRFLKMTGNGGRSSLVRKKVQLLFLVSGNGVIDVLVLQAPFVSKGNCGVDETFNSAFDTLRSLLLCQGSLHVQRNRHRR